ncbi:MAG: lipopolysaccharide biosynthesis protein [Sedimentisphaerales bacterium]|nr:lipopolysaccharide biosynthesis protein [Sedimentisphaerales bacterium]
MSLQSPPNMQKQIPSVDLNGSKPVDFFDTSHLKADIKGHSIRGGAVTIAAQGVKFVLHTVSTAILARLLIPADFGLIAMVSVFTEFVNLFKDLGLSMATIQKKDITHQQVSFMFWINVAMSILLMIIAAAISPFVARFYGEPRLVLITIAIGSMFIFGGLIAQHTALMRRQMRFSTLAVIEIAAIAGGITAASISAYFGLRYWSLVIMTAVRGIINVILVWWQSPWRPGRPTMNCGVRSMLAFGGSLTGSRILGYLTANSDNAIIGSALGSDALGFYSKAYGLLTLPMNQLTDPIYTIMIPALSRLQAEPKQYSRFYLQTFSAIVLMMLPLVSFLFVSADEIVYILLGSQWTSVSTTFKYLAPAAFFSAVGFAPGWLFISLGRAGTQFRVNLISTPIHIAGFLIGVHWGINGVAAAYSLTKIATTILAFYLAANKSPVRLYDIIHAVLIPAAGSLLAGIGVLLLGGFLSEANVFVRFILCSTAFTIIYVCFVMANSASRQLVRSMINSIAVLRVKTVVETTSE